MCSHIYLYRVNWYEGSLSVIVQGRSEIAILPRLKLISYSSIEKFRLKRGLSLCLTKFRSREKFKRKNLGDMGNQNRQLKIPRNLAI